MLYLVICEQRGKKKRLWYIFNASVLLKLEFSPTSRNSLKGLWCRTGSFVDTALKHYLHTGLSESLFFHLPHQHNPNSNSNHCYSHAIFFRLFHEGRGGCYHIFIPPFSRGRRVFVANPSFSMGEARAHPRWVASSSQGRGRHTRCQMHIRSDLGVQYLTQGYFDYYSV